MHETDALWDDIDRVLLTEGVAVERFIETQHSYPAYCFVAAGLGLTIAEPFSALLFARLGVRIRRFRPRIASNFTVLEPAEVGATPTIVEYFRDIATQVTIEHLAEVDRLATAPAA